MKQVIIDDIEAIGTHWWFEFFEPVKDITALKADLTQIMKEFEEKYSRFIDTSLVSTLNNNRVLLSNDLEFHDMLYIGIKLFEQTNGYFSFINGHIIEGLGYDKEYSFKQKKGTKLVPGKIEDLKINGDEITISGESKVDFGGFGKGYLIDKLAGILKSKYQLKYFLINGGGDVYVTSNNDKPVEIVLENPEFNGEYIAKIAIKDGSLCASSQKKRTWKDPTTGKAFSHIFNPKNVDFQPQYAVYTTGKNATYADAYSTAFIAAADDKKTIAKYAAENGIEAMIVDDGKYVRSPHFPELISEK